MSKARSTGDLVASNLITTDISNDYIGIGSGTPSAKLDVLGDVKLSGLMKESLTIVSGKLSDNSDINLDNGMVHFFTTTETTTIDPNIFSSTGINTETSIGETIAVNIITTCAAAGYTTAISVDGTTQTVKWNGGSLPSEGGSSGNDIYSFQILKTADETYTVFGTLTNFAAG